MTDIQVERSVEFQARNAHYEAVSCSRIKHTPINGSTWTKNNDFIEFRLSADGTMIDTQHNRLNVDFTCSATAGADGVFGVYTSPSVNSVFSRWELRQGGNILENCIDANRIFQCYSKIFSSHAQCATAGSLTDLYQDSVDTVDDDTVCACAGIKMNTDADANPPLVYKTKSCSIPLSMSNLLGNSATKAFPLALCKEPVYLRLYITSNVEEVLYCYTDGTTTARYGADTNFTLSNCSLELTHIRYDGETMNKIKEDMPNEVRWNGVQPISSTNSIGYSTQERVILPNTSYHDVRNVIINQWYPTFVSNQLNLGVSPLNGLYQAQLYANGSPICNNRPMGTSDQAFPTNANSAFASSVLKLNRPFKVYDDANTQIGLSKYLSASKTIQNFNVNNVGGGPSGYPYTLPASAIPDTNKFAPTSPYGIPPYYGYVGFDLTKNGDPTRENVGTDLVNKQLVYEGRHNNTITGETDCVCQAILSVGVIYVLDRQSGVIRTEY